MDELLNEIRRDFDVACYPVRVGNLTLDFYRVADPESLLTDEVLLASHEQLEWQPYWAETWDTSFGVAEELISRALQGKHVLDLGCGLGLTGTVAAACGATVVMADYAPPALQFARLNSWPFRERVEVIRLDWRRDRLERKFDLIVGSDILYDRHDLPYLDAFWQTHLESDGKVLLGDPTRALTNDLLTWLLAQGWHATETQRRTPLSQRPIRLVELARSQT
ncbi:MAG: methyltransferase domain-containing protein [Pirellulaceae bacterium]|nr:methyltransferase domain-containing protein [Pirellulaceae bacterium]